MVSINTDSYEVYLGERHLQLTSTEFRLLHQLVKNRSVVVSLQALKRVFGNRAKYLVDG